MDNDVLPRVRFSMREVSWWDMTIVDITPYTAVECCICRENMKGLGNDTICI